MKYVGSKNKISKYIVPIIQGYIDNNNIHNYYEPFVGGGNVIDKIDCENKYGSDINKYLIALLKQAQTDVSVFPTTYDEEFYTYIRKHYLDANFEYPDWYVGLVGFSTYGAKFFGGYPRGYKPDGITKRDIVNESIRNIIKQSPNLKGIKFACQNYTDTKNIKNFVIYCDPPYRNTLKYSGGDEFDHNEFYNWCIRMATNNIVLISEYTMPHENFECIWEKDVVCGIDNANNNTTKRTEKLFIVKHND